MIPKYCLNRSVLLSNLVVVLTLFSCSSKTDLKEWEERENILIQQYLAENDSLDFTLKPSGLYYLDVVVGTGSQAEIHDTAYVLYTMYSLYGNLLETNTGGTDTLVFPVNEGKLSVAGFDEGITYMKEGGKAKYLVPSKLAFGAQGTFTIPGFTPLIFDTELRRLVKHSGK